MASPPWQLLQPPVKQVVENKEVCVCVWEGMRTWVSPEGGEQDKADVQW